MDDLRGVELDPERVAIVAECEPQPVGVPSVPPGGGGAGVGVSGYIAGSVGDGGACTRQIPPLFAAARAAEREGDGLYPVREGWEGLLTRNDRGALARGVRNLVLILRNDPALRGRLRFNVLSGAMEYRGAPATDSDLLHLRGAVEAEWGLSASDSAMREAARLVAEFSPYDPRRDYLVGLRWDGRARIATVAERHFGSCGALYPRFLAAFFLGAVRRVFEPGCKHDTMLILRGPQGFRKSTFFFVLAGESWFTDSEIALGSKDAALVMAGSWIVELAEVDKHLAGKADDAVVKAALSSRFDTFRRPYASQPETAPRSSLLVGTTNKRSVFRDHTGSRRFHLVEVAQRIDAAALAAERDQLWAEAVARYLAGEVYWLSDEEEGEREASAEPYRRVDPWLGLVASYCGRAESVQVVNSRAHGVRFVVPLHDLLQKGLGVERREWRAHAVALGETMEQLGAVVGVARVRRVDGAKVTRDVEQVYYLPANWVAGERLADGTDAPPVSDDGAPVSGEGDDMP